MKNYKGILVMLTALFLIQCRETKVAANIPVKEFLTNKEKDDFISWLLIDEKLIFKGRRMLQIRNDIFSLLDLQKKDANDSSKLNILSKSLTMKDSIYITRRLESQRYVTNLLVPVVDSIHTKLVTVTDPLYFPLENVYVVGVLYHEAESKRFFLMAYKKTNDAYIKIDEVFRPGAGN